MKRASDESVCSSNARPKSDRSSLDATVAATVRILLEEVPSLVAPPPRKTWGLDRLVLDARCGEAATRSILRACGSDILALKNGTRLPEAPVMSLPGSGQSLAVAVGLAVGQRHLDATYAQPGYKLFEHRIFSLCLGGALTSGAASESSSLSGHLQLGSLVVICCDDGLLSSENVAGRYGAYRWCTKEVCFSQSAAGDSELAKALRETGKAENDKPTLIVVRPSATAPEADEMSVDRSRDLACRGAAAASAWEARFSAYGVAHAEQHAEIVRRFAGDLPANWRENFPEYVVGERAQATRQCSAKVLGGLVTSVPEMIGGSADLTGSNLTNQGHLKDFQHNKPQGRYLRFGVRENAMIGMCTGLAAYGGFVPFCGTFLNFFTYGWGALRMAAATSAHAIYVASHDSIELGEDGPTHQPVEVLAACRALKNLLVMRPADGPETVGAYEVAMLARSRPSLLALSRSGTPHLEGSSSAAVAKGAYVMQDFEPGLNPMVVLAASGTEVAVCAEVRTMLQAIGVGVRVVSMPCWELFEEHDEAYRSSVFAPSKDFSSSPKPLRVYVEASTAIGFHRYGELIIGMTSFGASGPAKDVRKHFGFEKGAISTKIMEALKERQVVQTFRIGRFGFCRFRTAVDALDLI